MFLVEMVLTSLITTFSSRPLILSFILIIFMGKWTFNFIIVSTFILCTALAPYFGSNTNAKSSTSFKKRFRHLNKYSLPESTNVVMQKRFKFIFLMVAVLLLTCL